MDLAAPVEELVPDAVIGDPDPDTELEEFFPPDFMEAHTRFDSFAEFRREGPLELDDGGSIAAVPERELDGFVDRTTRFDSWRAMRNAAAEREIYDRLLV